MRNVENEIYMEYKQWKEIESPKMTAFFELLNSTKRKSKSN